MEIQGPLRRAKSAYCQPLGKPKERPFPDQEGRESLGVTIMKTDQSLRAVPLTGSGTHLTGSGTHITGSGTHLTGTPVESPATRLTEQMKSLGSAVERLSLRITEGFSAGRGRG